jgi:hypothetical protein
LPEQTATARTDARTGSSPRGSSCFSSLQHECSAIAATFSISRFGAARLPGL